MSSAWKKIPYKQGLPLVIIVALSVALGFSLAANFYRHAPSTAIAAAPADLGDNWRTAFEKTAEEIGPTVVRITSEKVIDTQSMFPDMDIPFPFFGGPKNNQPDSGSRKQTMKATGSGVIVRSDGYILTNNHVVEGADRVTVQLRDGRNFTGKVMRDPLTDLAVVKIDATGLPAASLADSSGVRVGQWAMAVGNPMGLKNTVTVGVISAIRREDDSESGAPVAPVASEVIQTDASINPGNSGGPLIDLNGRVIGINFMIYSKSGGNEGIGFALPSNTAKFVMTQLIEKGKVVRGYLGVEFTDLTPVKADRLGVKAGAVVENVEPDSPADKAGLKTMDVITKVNGKSISNGNDLRNAVQVLTPGTVVKLTYVRDKKEKVADVKLVERPNEEASVEATDSDQSFGMQVQPLTPEMGKQLEIPAGVKGVVVRSVEAGTPADRAGIAVKDVITEINEEPVTSVASFSKAIKSVKKGETVLVVVQRQKRSVILELGAG